MGMRLLPTNTAVIVPVGPFYDKTDGITPETALTITNERITLVASTYAGSAPTLILDNITGATSGTANDLNYITNSDNGMMQIELAAADVNRLGFMRLTITDAANHCPVIEDFMVVPANIFNSLVAGTDILDVSITQLLGTAWLTPAVAGTPDVTVLAASKTGYSLVAATMASLGVLDSGTAAAIANGTITLRSGHGISGLASALVILTGGTAAVGKSRIITYSGSGDVFNVDPAWNANGETLPSGTLSYVVMPAPLAPTATNLPAVNVTQVGGVTQSATDLKDFVDTGYDPSTHKVAGVVLTDTVTTYTSNTPQTGDSFARIGAAGASLTGITGVTLAATQTGVTIPTVTTVTNAPTGMATTTQVGAVTTAISALLPSALTAGGSIKAALTNEAHGGSSAVLTLKNVVVNTSDAATPAVAITATGTGNSHGVSVVSTNGHGVAVGSTNANGYNIASAAEDAVKIQGGTNKDGLDVAGNGTGVDIRGDITGDVTGTVATVTTVTGGATSAEVAAILSTAMTESYSADGATRTAAQALYEICQILEESNVSGTTLTVKKVNGSTTALTLTLNDGTTPTGVTRAS